LISNDVTVFLSAWKAMSSRSSVLVIATEMVPLWPNVLPISDSVRAGTSAVAASMPLPDESHGISRTATR
jgi:hypothetical protein